MFRKLCVLHFLVCLTITRGAEYLFPEHAVVFSHPQQDKSYFGFAVQLQSARDHNGRVIVGAPNSSDIYHENLARPGAVFSCPFDSKSCQQYDFIAEGAADKDYIQGSNYSCLGFSLDADEYTDGRLVTCAPRWVNHQGNYAIPNQNGICLHFKNTEDSKLTNVHKLWPLRQADLQFQKYDYEYILGEAGFASHLLKDYETVAFTSSGLHNWTGGVIQYNKVGDNEQTEYVVRPKSNPKLETYSYFGYSLSSGRFNSSDPSKLFYVSGAPRSDNLTGMVYIYERLIDHSTFIKRYEYPGKQFGEYFGASLAVVDFNGDGTDDLVVGAPMHSTEENDEIGCVYLYITNKYDTSIKVQAKDKIVGEERGNRFGTAISSIGDINKDGCEDIVIGAPYYKEGGAIYLYLGRKGGSFQKYDQKILASDCGNNLRGFGYSLSRGVDVDNNYYNDLAVGAYLSDQVVVLRSRPIVSISSSLSADIKQIDMNTRSFIVKSCLKYTTKDVPSQLNIVTENRVNKTQISFSGIGILERTYKKDEELCENIQMTLKEGVIDSVRITMTYKINNNDTGTEFCKLCPIEEKPQVVPATLSIPFVSGCSEKICKSNLKLSAVFLNTESPLVIGSTNEIQIQVEIENLGENSFGTRLSMQLSAAKISVKSENMCKQSDSSVICDFVKPLATNDKISLEFTLNIENLQISETLLNVTLFVTSTSEDTDISDNDVVLLLPLTTDVKYNIATKSEPEQLLMTENITSIPNFIHTYSIESIGRTELEFLDVYFFIPYKINDQIIVDNILISDCPTQDNEEIIEAKYETAWNENLEKTINLNCSSTQTENLKCKKIKCPIRDSSKLKLTNIHISLDVNISVFNDEKDSIFLITTTEIDSKYLNMNSYARTTLIPVPQAAGLNILIVIIGIIVGIILIIIIGVILYFCGFFKRNRPQRPEDEALLEKKNNPEPGSSTQVDMNDDTKENDLTKDESDG